jgi:hypothetical protein
VRLSELLERIRPAGAPGAASEGEQQLRRENREKELADLIAALHHPEQAAADLLADTQQQVELLQTETSRSIAKQRADLPEQLAVQRTVTSGTADANLDDECDRILRQASEEADRINQQAAAGTPSLVTAALDSIWTTVLTAPSDPTAR